MTLLERTEKELDLLLYGKGGAICKRCGKSINKEDAKELNEILYCSCCYDFKIDKKLLRGGVSNAKL